MAGPWEDYSGAPGATSEEETGPWKAFETGSQDKQAAPGDTFTPRERRTFTGELVQGGSNILSGVGSLISGDMPRFIPDRRDRSLVETALAPLTETALGKTLSGVLQAANSWMYGLGDPSQALGDVVEKGVGAITGPGTTARYAGNAASLAGDLAQGLALGKAASVAKPIVERNATRLMSPRSRAMNFMEEMAAKTRASDIAQSNITSGTESAVESLQSIADAAQNQFPKAQELRRRFAPNAPLGKDAGAGFKAGWNQKFEEAKNTFEGLYGPLKQEASVISTDAGNFTAAGGKLNEAKGLTGTPGTLPERVASRIPNIAESADAVEERVLQQLKEAGPGQRGDVLKNIMSQGEVPAQNATVEDLINERQRLSSAYRALKDDNSRRQLNGLISALDADIAKAAPDLGQRLSAVNERYASEYVPYFSKGSTTRAIAQGAPETIVDQIYRPTVSTAGRTLKNDAIEAVTRAREVITDPKQWEKINGAFINKGLEHATEEGVFDANKFRKWWEKYKDPAGTGNEVLRRGLGEAGFKDMDAVFSQMGNAKTRSLNDAIAESIKNYKAQGKELLASEKAATKATVEELQRRIDSTLGNKTYVYRKLESIGAGIIASGLMRGNVQTMSRGGLLAVSAHTLGEVLGLARGRSAWRAVVRSAPGTLDAQAGIKQFQAVVQQLEEEKRGK